MSEEKNVNEPELEDDGIEIESASTKEKKARQRIYIGIAIFLVVAVALSSMLAGEQKPIVRKAKERTQVIDTTPDSLGKRSWELQSQADIDRLRKRIEDMSAAQQQLLTELKDTREALKEQRQEQIDLQRKLDEQAKTPLPPPPVPAKDGSTKGKPGKSGTKPKVTLPPPPPLPPGVKRPTSTKKGDGIARADQPIILNAPELPEDANTIDGLPAEQADIRYSKNKFAGNLSPGIAKVALLHGIDAGSSDYTRTNPEPLLMRIQTNALMPGGARYKLKGCFVMASVFGDLSSERVQGRLTRLFCMDKRNHLVLSAKLEGYILDSDGSKGLRGVVDRRAGALIANSVIANFAEGLSSVFSAGMGATSTSALGAVSTISGSAAMQASGLQAAGGAIGSVSDYFLDQAKNIFPVISVKPGRKGSIVIAKDTQLEWHDYGKLYVPEIKPMNKDGGR